MSRDKSLQALLSPKLLRDLAGPKVYPRGEAYLEQGKVLLREHAPDRAVGEVTGTHPYRVEMSLTPKGLLADCTCPAMADFGFCKHAVALGLFLIAAPPPAKGTTSRGRAPEPDDFTRKYPHIAGWIKDGTIEIGRDGFSASRIRVLDEGGLVWEGGTRHTSLDAILEEADQAIAKWMEEN